MHSKVDPSTLGWVKSEIDETLKQARLALESFAENPSDKTRLRFCVTHLHQVVGTLLMVELDGAALLAKETEALADAVFNDKAPADARAFEVLTRGIVTLPDYLARLQYGQPDIPLKHLALINELRAAHQDAPIAEAELFSVDLSARPPNAGQPKEHLSSDDYRALAKQLRGGLQTSLLEWLRDNTNKQPLRQIADIFEQLQTKAGVVILEQLFWGAGGFLETLIDDSVAINVERKKIFARLDQQVKKIIDDSDKSLLRSSSEALLRAILWEVGQAPARGPKAIQIKQAFGLDQLLENEPVDEAGNAGMPTPETMQSVSAALGKEIEAAQDLMSTYFDPEQRGAVSLEPLYELLRKMSGTLDMLNIPVLKVLVDELGFVARAMIDQRLTSPEAAAMPMAEALLLVEQSTRDIGRSGSDWKKQVEEAAQHLHALHTPVDGAPAPHGFEVSDAELSETEYKALLSVVGTEVSVNLSKVEEALESFAADTARVELLDEAPLLLSQILGALQILGQTRAVELVEHTQRHIKDIRSRTLTADSAIMDGLAVCIGTIGAYVDGLRAGRRNLDSLIDAALQEIHVAVGGRGAGPDPAMLIETLRLTLETWLENPEGPEETQALQQQLDELTRITQEQEQQKIASISSEMNHLLHLVTEDPSQLSTEAIKTLKQSFTAMSVLAGRRMAVRSMAPTAASVPSVPVPSAPIPPVAKSPPPKTAEQEEFDDEIMQIFIEDARDVLANITSKFAVWRGETGNQAALTELRRGYHTLKGSGRMVGATDVAELSWAVENVLNKVRDGKILPSPSVVNLLQQAQDVLPSMVDTLAGGPPHAVDTVAMRATANALAAAVEPSPSAVPAAAAPDKNDLPALDSTLLEIFTNEARGNLANILQEIAHCREAGSACLVSDSLFRSTHTLLGNARSLGLQVMFDACGEMEKLLNALKMQNFALSETHLFLAGRLEAVVSELVNLLNNGATSSGALRVRFAELSRDIRAENARVQQPGSDDDSPEISNASPNVVDVLPADASDIEEIDLTVPEPVEPPPPTPAMTKTTAMPAAAAPEETVAEQIDPELMEIFQEEATDILNVIEESLTRWRSRPEDRPVVQELKRSLHTLKGGARMAGAMTMGTLSHNTETLLRHIEEGKFPISNEVFDLLDESHDMLVTMLQRAQGGRPLPVARGLNNQLLALASGQPLPQEAVAPAPPPASVEIAPTPLQDSVVLATVAPVASQSPPVEVRAIDAPDVQTDDADTDEKLWPEKTERRGQVRVNTSLLNELVNYAGEVSISRSRMEQQIYSVRDNLGELARNIVRFRDQIRELEIQSESQILYRMEQEASAGSRATDFDPLELDRFSRLQQLSRSLAESLHDLGTIQNNLGNFVGEAEAVLQQQARINTELQEGLMRTRMVNFSTQGARLRHIVRSTARELGKRAELHLQGAEVEIDRNVLDRMIGPFEHMIRNSLDHGIESADERKRRGKSVAGRINIATAQEGSEIIIRIADDGAGLNIAAIRQKAIERGLMSTEVNLTEEELIQFILMSGFSTASQITHVSGRGVGMDVVHNEVKQLGGSMSVDTESGVGTTFTIRLPQTLSIAQALMVHVGDQLFAVPLSSVVNIIEYQVDKLDEITLGKNPMLNHNEQVYPYMHLGARLGIASPPRAGRKVPVLIARTGTREVAIQIDGLGGTREVVVKALGPQLAEIKGLGGATILGDGRVILILDVPGLWYRDDIIHFEHRRETTMAAPEVRERPVIMVVDDSLTVRKITSKHLQKRGMDVMVAKDGIDAVEQLRDRVPDLMLVDIEMPRMDGYELTTRVRSDADLKHVPIIMITSRAGGKHRQKAFDLGVDMYMSKPYQEEELFKNVDNLLAQGRKAR